MEAERTTEPGTAEPGTVEQGTVEQGTAEQGEPEHRLLRRNPAALVRDLDTTLLVQIPPPAAASFDLSETGRMIWLLLDSPIEEGELIGLIVDETAAATESDIAGIRGFIDELVDLGAIEIPGMLDAH